MRGSGYQWGQPLAVKQPKIYQSTVKKGYFLSLTAGAD